MALQKLKLMISSRCKTRFPFGDNAGATLTEIRKELKKDIEAEKFLGQALIKVWINEDETADGSVTSWEACLKEASDCDFFIALFDGEAGYQKDRGKSGIGICHAEFSTAYSQSPAKVRVISLVGDDYKPKAGPNADFLAELVRADVLEARNFTDAEGLKARTKQTVRELLLQVAHEGAREVKRSGSNTGQALDWSRLNFSERQQAMTKVIVDSLAKRKDARRNNGLVVVPLANGTPVLFRPTAMPEAFSVSAAREMVGQPFLQDHELVESLKTDIGGPVHIIACRKNVTEAQAMSLLGFPDATIVSGSFGVYAADDIQKIQLCLISNCRDPASTKHGLQKLLDWLERTREVDLLTSRAVSRAKILKTIAGELK